MLALHLYVMYIRYAAENIPDTQIIYSWNTQFQTSSLFQEYTILET